MISLPELIFFVVSMVPIRLSAEVTAVIAWDNAKAGTSG